MVGRAATRPVLLARAGDLGIDPLVFAVALIARSIALQDRHAARVARAILGDPEPSGFDAVSLSLDREAMPADPFGLPQRPGPALSAGDRHGRSTLWSRVWKRLAGARVPS